MGVFRYADKYAAPTKEQRERYMTGKSEENHFGPGGQKNCKSTEANIMSRCSAEAYCFCSNPVDTRAPG